MKQRRRLVSVVAGIQQPTVTTAVAAPTPTVAPPPSTAVPALTVPVIQPPITGQHDFSFTQHMANLIYQDLHPVALGYPWTTGTISHLPAVIPPPATTDLQPSTTEFFVDVSPTNHVEAPDDITTSDDESDSYSDKSQDEDFSEIQPMAADVFLRTLQLRATDIRTLKHERH
jgi:hypothetical protein